jgi:peptidyl-prolyl cis-trans isomerase A (cyclophilin A)
MRASGYLGALLVAMIAPAIAESPVSSPAPAPTPAAAAAPAIPVEVAMQTALGTIQLRLDVAHAPITVANFLRYVDQKRFDGISFYRAMKLGEGGEIGLVQAGLRGDSKRVFKPIAHEPTSQTGLSHVSGALSMARGEPGTATADFFIVLGDCSSLDASAADPGYAVFGRVTTGMEVVRAIIDLPRSETAQVAVMKGQMLLSPLKILSVRRVPAGLSGAPE